MDSCDQWISLQLETPGSPPGLPAASKAFAHEGTTETRGFLRAEIAKSVASRRSALILESRDDCCSRHALQQTGTEETANHVQVFCKKRLGQTPFSSRADTPQACRWVTAQHLVVIHAGKQYRGVATDRLLVVRSE